MNKKFKDCLFEVYLGEQAGEMIFESLLASVEENDHKYIYSNMLQLETEGKAIMRPLLVRLGLPIEENKELRNQGLEIAEAFKNLSFKEQIQNIHKSVSEIYLPQYEELATLVDEENTQAHFIAKFMGDHERAILQASENILKGTNNPIEPITKLLKYPI